MYGMNKFQTTYIPILICILLFNIPTQAQYEGGFGDGTEKSSVIQITLNGDPINPLALYRGGFGDGQDKEILNATLAGGEIASLYLGGNNDGHAKDDFQGTIAGAEIAFLYMGSDGHTRNISNTANCMMNVIAQKS